MSSWNVVPIATRRARRAKGSEDSPSSTTPVKPNAAALRAIAPTLVGLSTWARTTMRSLRATNSATSTNGGLGNSATIDNATPSPVAALRVGSSATTTCAVESRSPSCSSIGITDASHTTKSGTWPTSRARITTRSPSATNFASVRSPRRWRRVFNWRSRNRNGSNAGSSTPVAWRTFSSTRGTPTSRDRAFRGTNCVPRPLHRSCRRGVSLRLQKPAGRRGRRRSG